MGYGPQDWDLTPGIWHSGADPRVWKHKACGERLEFPDDKHVCCTCPPGWLIANFGWHRGPHGCPRFDLDVARRRIGPAAGEG